MKEGFKKARISGVRGASKAKDEGTRKRSLDRAVPGTSGLSGAASVGSVHVRVCTYVCWGSRNDTTEDWGINRN